jgi:TRAP-type C4-dicarboxylate transport system permease small subunit
VNKLFELYFRLLKFLMAAMLLAMVILVFGNVVMRYGFNSGIILSEELSRWLFVWMTFLGAIVAMREHGHLGVDAFVRRLPRRGKQACLAAVLLLMLYATWLLLVGTWKQAVTNLPMVAPVSGLSFGIFYASGVVFSVSTGLILLIELYRLVTGRAADEELVVVEESEELEVQRPTGVGMAPSRHPG